MRLTNEGFDGIFGTMKEYSGDLFLEQYNLLNSLIFAEKEHNLDDEDAWEYFLDQLESILDNNLGQEFLGKFRDNLCTEDLVPARRAIEIDLSIQNLAYIRELTDKMVPLTPEQDARVLSDIKDLIGRVSMFIYNLYNLSDLIGLDKLAENTPINVGYYSKCGALNEDPLATARKIKQILENNLPEVSVFDLDSKVTDILYSVYPEYIYDFQDLAQYVTYSGVKSILNCEVDVEDYLLSLYKEQIKDDES